MPSCPLPELTTVIISSQITGTHATSQSIAKTTATTTAANDSHSEHPMVTQHPRAIRCEPATTTLQSSKQQHQQPELSTNVQPPTTASSTRSIANNINNGQSTTSATMTDNSFGQSATVNPERRSMADDTRIQSTMD